MYDTEVSLTSLCYIGEDYDGRMWLYRLADIENGILYTPFKSNHTDNYFENRDRLYRNDGPSLVGSVGIWDWTAIPNRDNPAIDYVQSYYVDDVNPIRVVVLNVNSIEEIVEQLRSGTARTQAYFCDTLFCYEPRWGQLQGVLCYANDFSINDKSAKLSDRVYSLPCYMIKSSEVFNWDDRNLRFYRKLKLDEPSGYISIGNSDEIIRTLLLERWTWPLFKECVGATKADWRNSKTLLEKICNDSLYEIIAEKLKCSSLQAKQTLNDFIERAYMQIDAEDIDADVLAQIAMRNDTLRLKCEEVVAQKWKDSHAAEILDAENELSVLRKNIDQEMLLAKQNLHNTERNLVIAEDKRNRVLEEISNAESKLNELLSEIEAYEKLGEDTVAAIREKIAVAQKDMSGFITELSVFLPQTRSEGNPEVRSVSWKYLCASELHYTEDEVEYAEDWNDEFNTLSQNLSHALSISPELCDLFTAFLYSAYINNISVLIAGPGGSNVADTLSISICSANSGQLSLGNEYDCALIDELARENEQIVSVKNMFGKGWADNLPHDFGTLNKHIIWTHPFVEDLIIEPKGLYNYMLPVFSECFVEAISDNIAWAGKRAENFVPYKHKKKLPVKISAIKRLGLSKILLNRLERVLSDAKAILDNQAKEKDLEFLFVVLPFCVLTGKTELLKSVLEDEKGLSNVAKEEAARYIEEE